MGRKQNDSDPLPFVQVDRSAEPKVALLASELSVSTQHALGSLVQWWRLNAEPRALEVVISQTPPGKEPAVIIDQETARLRFRLASGHDVASPVLVELGLVAPVEGGKVRVRGMSRYLGPIADRAKRREAGAKGGRATMAALAARAQAPAGASAQGGGRAPAQASAQAGAQAPVHTEIRDQRSEIRDQRSDAKDLAGRTKKAPKQSPQPTLPGVPDPEPPARKLSWQQALYEDFNLERQLGFSHQDWPEEPEDIDPVYINTVLDQRLGHLRDSMRSSLWQDIIETFMADATATAKKWPFKYLMHGEVFLKTVRATKTRCTANDDTDSAVFYLDEEALRAGRLEETEAQ